MALCTPASAACAPAAVGARTAPRTASRQPQRLLAAPCSRAVRCRAEEPGSSGNAPATEQQQGAVPPPPQPPSQDDVAPWNRTPSSSQIDMSSQPDALGPVGNVLMALLLTALCAGSFFTTVGRQFQADLVPLTPEMMAEMNQ